MRQRQKILVIGAMFLIASLFVSASYQGAYTTKLDYDGSDRLQYIGRATAGTATSAAAWQIERLTYDGASTRIADRTYAAGNIGFVHIWDNRATLAYSY